MEIAVERRPGSKVALTITVEPSIVEQQTAKVFQKYSRRVTVPGFRPGKAPRKMLEERVNHHLVQQEAIEEVIDITYKDALKSQELEPLERGEIEDMNTGADNTLTYTVLVSVRPEITLPAYTGLEVKRPSTIVTDEQVETEIERLRERTADFVEIADDGIQKNDYVTIDYTMSLNGEAYPEGDATGYPLEVGTDTFFPELNESLLGIKQGEDTTVTTTYAEDYSNKDFAGKTATFEITVQQVRRRVMPEATDEWVAMLSQGSLANIDALRARLHENLQAVASQGDHDQVRNELVRQVVEKSELEIPETLVEEELQHLMHEFEHRLSHERMTIEEYAEFTSQNIDDIRNEQQLLARDMVRRSLVLQDIARREQLFVSEEEVNATLQALKPANKSVQETRKELEKSGRLDSLVSRLFHEKIMSFLESHAQIEIEGAPAAATTTEEPANESVENAE